MASNAPRHLLRGATCPASLSCRLLPRTNPYRIAPSRSYKRSVQPVPPAPPPRTQSDYAQKAQERALLSKLSALSPDQITALLSNQPDTAPPPPPPPSFGSTNTQGGPSGSKWRRRLTSVLLATVAILVGHQAGELFIDFNSSLNVIASYPSDEEEEREDPNHNRYLENGEHRSLSTFVNASAIAVAKGGSSPDLLGLPMFGVYWINPSGLVTYTRRGHFKPGFVVADGQRMLVQPDEVNIINGGSDGSADQKIVSWPAHMRLLDRLDTHSAIAKRRQQHLVTGALGSVQGLGGIYQVIKDPMNDALSVFVSFGRRTCGPAGTVHSGAISTVLDESMGRLAVRHLPSNTAVTAKLIVTFANDVVPVVDHLYKIELDILTKDAAASLEHSLRIDAACDMVPMRGQRQSRGPMNWSEETFVPTLRGEPPRRVALSQVQTDRKVWIRARMYSAIESCLICEAEGLFVVPKGVELEKLGEHW